MTDTTSQPKTCHAAHRISTGILAVLILLGIGAYGLWDHTEHRGYFSMSLGDDPLMQTTDDTGDIQRQQQEAHKTAEKSAHRIPAPAGHVRAVSDVPEAKPTPPAGVQQ